MSHIHRKQMDRHQPLQLQGPDRKLVSTSVGRAAEHMWRGYLFT